jgi:protoheme IX farnesyltransferase
MLAKYFELTKPKVTLLNLLVGVTCFTLAAYPFIDWVKLAVFCFVGYLAAGGCGVLNSVYDQDIDKLMPRTSKRAIPLGYVAPKKALALGSVMVVSSIAFAYFYFNVLTALMLILGAAFYLYIYTVWLKRITPWNVVIGGFAGCFAALSGWTAAANMVSWMPLIVALLDFLWTPGHLWGLAIKKIREYRAAGVPMLPVKVGIRRTAKVVFWLNVGTVVSSLLFPLLQLSGAIYLAVASVAGAVFLLQHRGLLASSSEAYGFRVFVASMPYLTCLMLGLMVDKIFLI